MIAGLFCLKIKWCFLVEITKMCTQRLLHCYVILSTGTAFICFLPASIVNR